MTFLVYVVRVISHLKRMHNRPDGYYDRFVCEYMVTFVGDEWEDVPPQTRAIEITKFLRELRHCKPQYEPLYVPVYNLPQPSMN